MVAELFNQCLFALPSERDYSASAAPLFTAKCKTHSSRSMALSLLAELARNCEENFREVIRLLKPHHVFARKEETSWDNPKIFEKSSSGFVGLKNLGSICYVNSLMQQFFMMPDLRNTLLQVDTNPEAKNGEDLMNELQLMFSYLGCSERQYYNPSGFCKAFRDWEGNPINTAMQADVLEFLNILCDHLENNLKGTPYQELLNESFAGTLSQEFICKDCPHYSETLEPFYTISVDIKGKKDLLEALDSFVEGEMLEGNSAYSCEQCKKKVRALKRCSIKKLSPTLIIHLKRFEYVLDRQTPNKLCDRFEFPLTLDLEPYTKEDIARREGKLIDQSEKVDYQYELVGVLVHSGHADAGHYYSFIKDRNSRTGKSEWFRFDDTQVTPFDINNLAEECFGGMQKTTYSSWNGYVGTREQPRMKNAYMLFYDRVSKGRDKPTVSVEKLIREPLLKRIRQENYQLLRDRQLFDSEYFNFMRDLIYNAHFPKATFYDEDPKRYDIPFETIQLATFFVFETLFRVREQKTFVSWMQRLKELYANHVLACKWFMALLLTDRRNWFRYLLLECYDEYVREHFADLVYTALKILGPYEYSFYLQLEDGSTISRDQPDGEATPKGPSLAPKAMCVKFMENFLSMMELTRQHWRRFSQYFKLLRDYALLGPWERLYLAHKHIVAQLVDYYMGPFSPNLRPGVQRVRIGDNNSPADLNFFMQAMAILVRSQAADGAVKLNRVPPTAFPGNIEYPPLHEKDKRLLYNRDFFASLIKQGYNVDANREIVAHCTWEDEERTQWMLEILMDLICKANWNACENLFAAVEAMLEVHDSIEAWRFEITLNLEDNGLIDIVNYYKDRYPKFTQTCIKFTIKIINEFPLAAAFLYYRRKEWWSWLEPWLRTRMTQHPSDGELAAVYRDLKDFVDGKLATKHEEDYVNLWKPETNHDQKKNYKLFIQKF